MHSRCDGRCSIRSASSRLLDLRPPFGPRSPAEQRPRALFRTDTNYRVEANWIQSRDADILALSNWTGKEQTIALELENAPAYGEISPVAGKILSKETKDGTLRVRAAFAAGDFILLKH